MDHYSNGDSRGSAQDHYSHHSTPDETMGGIDESSTSTLVGGYENNSTSTLVGGHENNSRPRTSQSADFPASTGTFSPHTEADRYPPSNMTYQQQAIQTSRPSSELSGANNGYNHAYQEQNQAASKTQSSVVIKVGMVGDAQIGKTSLMVKYVEGSWDEDYIQTLGMILKNQTQVQLI